MSRVRGGGHDFAIDLDGHALAVKTQALEEIGDRTHVVQGACFAVDSQVQHGCLFGSQMMEIIVHNERGRRGSTLLTKRR